MYCMDFIAVLDDTGQMNLDTDHVYYHQILGTMAIITAASFCDFVVWTPKSMEIININFDKQRWMHIKLVLENFYVNYMIPVAILY